MTAQMSVLVIGANRGIGLSLLKSFVKRSYNVTGTIRLQTRNDPSVDELRATGANILEVDYLDEESIKQAASKYGERPLDVLINVGGLPPAPRHWHEQTGEMMIEKFRVMTVGPFLAIKHFQMQLELAPNPKVINISSAFGSLLDNDFGLFLGYRAAKSALNQVSVTLAREWEKEGRKTTIVCVEPGFLSTRLTNFDGEDDMETCIDGLMKVFDGITPKDNGAFLKWDGTTIPF
ncbi:hypothetical protein F5883DRAFT_68372 [Diaporthe sp. PMI_573]|nr:hypothetical protein F5883DRAFT_68372 [Diaporthaceae sp. PMI_573]